MTENTELDLKSDFVNALNEFYHNYIIETVNGSFQVFQSFTYGEMTIAFLLSFIILIMLLKWVYEVIS